MAKLFLAAGHGGSDPGAVGNGTNERDLTISLINQCAQLLTAQDMKGRQLVVVPHNLNLIDEINWINAQSNDPGHDLCIEVHLNAGGGTGVETWFYSGIQVSADFANEINGQLVAYTGLVNRGIKGDATNRWGRLGFIRDTAPLAALIELGFIDNANDVARVKEKGAVALAAACLKASGGAYVVPTPPVVAPPVVPAETPKAEPQVPQVPVATPESDSVKVDVGALNKLINYLVELFKRIFGGK